MGKILQIYVKYGKMGEILLKSCFSWYDKFGDVGGGYVFFSRKDAKVRKEEGSRKRFKPQMYTNSHRWLRSNVPHGFVSICVNLWLK